MKRTCPTMHEWKNEIGCNAKILQKILRLFFSVGTWVPYKNDFLCLFYVASLSWWYFCGHCSVAETWRMLLCLTYASLSVINRYFVWKLQTDPFLSHVFLVTRNQSNGQTQKNRKKRILFRGISFTFIITFHFSFCVFFWSPYSPWQRQIQVVHFWGNY